MTAKDYVAEKKRAFYDKFSNSDWKVSIVKKDEKTGELTGRFACCAPA